MNKIIKKATAVLLALMMTATLTAFAEDTDAPMELTPMCDNVNIEVGDQFLVSFTMTNPQKYLTYQVQGTFSTDTAQIIAPVYSNGFTVVQNEFSNIQGTFILAAADLSISGGEDVSLCSILFEATAPGEFHLNLVGDELVSLIGKYNVGEDGVLFYPCKLNDATFVISEDSDGENAVVIDEPDPITPFDDLFGYDWAERSVGVMYNLGALDNIADTSFRPAQNITRGDFITMLVKVCKLTAKGEVEPFGDIEKDSYIYEPSMVLKSLNIALGDESGNFNPDENITRQDVCAILFRTMRHMNKVRAMDDAQKYIGSFSDKDSIAEYAADSVAAMIRAEIILGDDSSLLRPTDNMTRAEAAVVLNRVAIFNRLISL